MPSATKQVHTPVIILPEFCHNRLYSAFAKSKKRGGNDGLTRAVRCLHCGYAVVGIPVTRGCGRLSGFRMRTGITGVAEKTGVFTYYNRSGTLPKDKMILNRGISAEQRTTGAIVTVKATGSEEQTA